MFIFGKREELFTFNTSRDTTPTAMRGMCTCPAVLGAGFPNSEETTEFPASIGTNYRNFQHVKQQYLHGKGFIFQKVTTQKFLFYGHYFWVTMDHCPY